LVLNICVIIGRLLGKLVYLNKFSDCIIATLFDLHVLMIEISFDYYISHHYLFSSHILFKLCRTFQGEDIGISPSTDLPLLLTYTPNYF
jgi:hypothetical protein